MFAKWKNFDFYQTFSRILFNENFDENPKAYFNL